MYQVGACVAHHAGAAGVGIVRSSRPLLNCICIYSPICVYVYVYMYTYISISLSIAICIHICTCIYIYIYSYAHPHGFACIRYIGSAWHWFCIGFIGTTLDASGIGYTNLNSFELIWISLGPHVAGHLPGGGRPSQQKSKTPSRTWSLEIYIYTQMYIYKYAHTYI